jgi:hypothetical protein
VIVIILLISAIPLGLHIGSENVSAANPVLSNYGALPQSADAGASYLFWCTYSDADNDSPTTMQISRQYLTSPVYNMIANNTGDTNYVDGKQYYYVWYYLPFIGSNQMRFLYASNGSTVAFKPFFVTQMIPPVVTWIGMSPPPYLPGNYSFYATYQSVWFYQPLYMDIWVDGVVHNMTKNNSGDTDPTDGIAYFFNTTLTTGLHNYSFHTAIYNFLDHDRTVGNFTARIYSDNMTISLSPDMTALILGIVFGFGLIVISVVDKSRKIWPVFTGLAWFVVSIVAFYPVGLGWMVLGIGIGLIMWIEGAMQYASGRTQ